MKTKLFIEISEGFGEYIHAKGLKLNTRKELSYCIDELLFYLENNGCRNVMDFDEYKVLNYYHFLLERQTYKGSIKLKGASVYHHIYAMRTFFGWLYNVGGIYTNPMQILNFPKASSSPQIALSQDEIKQLFKACETISEKAMLAVYYGCGLRRTEGENLIWSDVDFAKGILLVRKGKFHKRRVVPIHFNILEIFKEFRIKFFVNANSKFLVSDDGKPLQGAQCLFKLKKICSKASINPQGVHLHLLRHSIATHLKENGMSLTLVSQFLGHSSTTITNTYLQRIETNWKLDQRVSRKVRYKSNF